MGGLSKIAKLYGGITINGTKFVWDYAADEAVKAAEMPTGSERHKASERARYLNIPPRTALQCQARGCDGCAICKPDDRGQPCKN